MTDLKTDAEKAEEIKQWWKDNGTAVLTGVAMAIAGVFGWQQWQAHQLSQAEEASALFSHQQKQNNPVSLAQLKTDASSSPYASLAALDAAKQAAEAGNDDQARTELQWTIDHSSDALIQQVARLHLIRLEISTQKLDKAKSLLNHSFNTAYASIIAELKGDLYLSQDKVKDATSAYNEAIQLSGGNPPRYLQMKIDSINKSEAAISASNNTNKGT